MARPSRARRRFGPIDQHRERRLHPFEAQSEGRGVLFEGLRHPLRAQALARLAGEDLEEALRAIAQVRHLGQDLGRVHPRGREFAFDVAAQFLGAIPRNLGPEVLGGRGFEGVRFVEDEDVVGGDDLAVVVLAHREVGHEQVMVHHHDFRLGPALAHLGDVAALVLGALLADAVLAGGRDLTPEVHGVGQAIDLRPVPGHRFLRPFFNDAEERDLVHLLELARRLEGGEPQPAEVVAPALHQGHSHVAAQGLGHEGNVFVHKLVLQVLGAGGDDDALPRRDRGHEIGDGFAGAGAGFREQNAAVGDRLRDGETKLLLGDPLLVGGEDGREAAAGSEEVGV
jgi:hypothetical protein